MEDFFHGVQQIVLEYWLVISTVLVATLMAIFRTAKTHGRVDWLESGMCGIFAYCTWFVLGWFNMPEGAGVMLGGIIGYRGTHFVSDWISKKLGFDNVKDK